MKKYMAVSICTHVYNTKEFLARCVESVLKQTFPDFEYILIDNGSTDGCKEMMEEYAAKDDRIRLFRLEENVRDPWRWIVRENAQGKYIALLDSDDWLDPAFIERLVCLLEQGQADIVCTGTAFHAEGQEEAVTGTRMFPQQVTIGKLQYHLFYPYYHQFFRTTWGKMMRREVFLSADLSFIDRDGIKNGCDTLAAFAWLRQAKQICLDNSILHHYLVRNKSVSHIYLPNRFKSNTLLHQDAVDFLSQYGPISKQNLHFLHIVYANAVYDTLEVLWNSGLTPEEKLAEYCTIAAHPTTRESYQDTDAMIDRSRNTLLQQLLDVAGQAGEAPGHFSSALQVLLPRCGQAFSGEFLPLLQRETALMEALRRDDWDALVGQVMAFILEKKYIKQFPILKLLHGLIPSTNPLHAVPDIRFFQKHTETSMLILCENYGAALEQMTGVLLEKQKVPLEGLFLQLYLALASRGCEEAAFIFGKIRLAEFYLRQARFHDVREVLGELEELGVQDNEELAELRGRLKAQL